MNEGCKSKSSSKKAPVAKNAPLPVGAAVEGDDDGDDDGDDGDRAPPPKSLSAKADADANAAAVARLAGKDFGNVQKQTVAPKVTVKKDNRGGCGEIHVGTRTYKMDCDSQDYANIKSASSSVMTEDDFAMGAASPGAGAKPGAPPAAPVKLPPAVDFREKKVIGPVLDQGNSLSCTAVSLAAVVNHELAALGKPADVSSMHIWARYANPNFNEAIQGNEGKLIVPMAVLPFNDKLADKWDKAQPPPPNLLAGLDPKAVVKIVDVEKIEMKDIKGTLAQGHAVWFGLAAAHYIQKTTGQPGQQVIPPYDWHDAPPAQSMGHALALMGYTTAKNGKTYYLVQNSWGTDWGDKGFAYIDEDTLKLNLRGAYSLEVQPAGAKPTGAAMGGAVGMAGAAAPTKCKPGLLPDATTGKCAAKCADGSARNDNVCAEAGDCPQGEVNVKGKCVRAAPTLKIKKDNFAVNCVPGGCLYGFAKGTAGCNRDKGCVAACAAPTFKLFKTASGFRCH